MTILAGGEGSRLWPLSTPSKPKQLLSIGDGLPLVVGAVERARRVTDVARIRIVAGRPLIPRIREILPELGPENFLAEPEPRGTAPALAWAAWTVMQADPQAVMVSLHADHAIEPETAFADSITTLARLARREGLLFTVGASPDRPETGYGYIEPGEPLEDTEGLAVHRVRSFHEKPDPATAQNYVRRGFLWNTGIFAWTVDAFWREIRRHAPEVSRALDRLDEGNVPAFFAETASVSVDVAVLERSSEVGVAAADFAWDDLGGWEALARIADADEQGNVLLGDALPIEAARNIVFSEQEPVIVYGIDDLLVVRVAKATLVTSRSRSSDLKRLIARLPDDLRVLE